MPKHNSFENFLEEKFTEVYPVVSTNNGDAEEQIDAWMSELDVQEVIDYAEEYTSELEKKYDIVTRQFAAVRVVLKDMVEKFN